MTHATESLDLSPEMLEAAAESKAWPFEEARKIVARYRGGAYPETVLFETGYGPSGLPHIGTFGEVARTTMVRHAFRVLTEDKVPTRLLCFSDDMDGMRKIPDNVPDRSFLEPHLHKPLTVVPDPFGGGFVSFGHHNNAMLRRFLDAFGFDYEFASATDYYRSGRFDAILKRVAERYDAIMAIMLPTLGEERRATYSPFLPISPMSGRVLYVPMKKVDAEAGTIPFDDEDGAETTLPVTGGRVKLQWKPDFGARWAALGVDFEMFGKDHGPNMGVYDRICEALGGRAPEHFVYELFLDENGQKISKSKGNGLTIDEWLTYGSEESLGFYIFPNPKSAKQLHVGVIPRAVDDYWQFRERLPEQTLDKQLGNPAWHLLRANGGYAAEEAPGAGDSLPVTYGLLLNLVGVMGAGTTRDQVWAYLGNYIADPDPAKHPELDALVGTALAYNRDFIAPTLKRRAPAPNEAAALRMLDEQLAQVPADTSAEDLQTMVYEIGKREEFAFESLRDWFKALYETLLGSEQGPRMGSFIALYGVANTRDLIAEALAQA